MKLIDQHFNTYKEYFEQFTSPPLQQGEGGRGVRSYYCDLIETVIAASRSEESFGYPLLHLEHPQIRFEERSEMLIVHFDSVGVVLVQCEDTPAAKNAAFATARQIWDTIFSRLKTDSIYKDILIQFDLNNVKGETVLPTFVDRCIGYEFRFTVTFWAQGYEIQED